LIKRFLHLALTENRKWVKVRVRAMEYTADRSRPLVSSCCKQKYKCSREMIVLTIRGEESQYYFYFLNAEKNLLISYRKLPW